MLDMVVALIIFCSNNQCMVQKLGEHTVVLALCNNDIRSSVLQHWDEGDNTLKIVVQPCYSL